MMQTGMRAAALMVVLLIAGPVMAMDAPMALPKAETVAGKTLVVFSTWAKAKSDFSVSEVAIINTADETLAARAPIDQPRLKSHFSKGWGYLNAYQLKPGSYRMALYSDEPYYDYDKASQQIRFTVKEGQPLYLGEASFSLDKGIGRLVMRDSSKRDLQLFQEKNPGFDLEVLKKSIPKKPVLK